MRILGASSDLCAYSDWELIQTWALMRNVSPKLCAYLSMGTYLSPGHLIGNLRYFSIVARPLKSLSANLCLRFVGIVINYQANIRSFSLIFQRDLSFCKDLGLLVSSGYDSTVRFWNCNPDIPLNSGN